MADFCRDCSIAMFGEDFKELALAPDDPKRGTLSPGEGWVVLCEGCGAITVNDDGVCQQHTTEQHNHVISHGTLTP